MKYELTFYGALDVLVNNKGWVQGENFADGMVLMFDKGSVGLDYIHCHDFMVSFHDSKVQLQITRGILDQKYRVVHTQPDAERKLK